jgi:putative superfamily III holin-X
MAQGRDERSLGELFGDLTSSMSTLIRKEIELARTEMTAKAMTLSRDAGLIGAGGALLYAAVLGLLVTAGLVLIEFGVPAWLAALMVTIVVAAIGALLVATGQANVKKADLAPRRTIETVKDDAEWAKERFQ